MSDPLHILIVEDSENDTILLLRELRRGGYDPIHERVDSAAGLKAALQGRSWDIIISDYVMPDFGGLEALRIVQAADPDVPFIIVSGNIGEGIAVDAMKAGANDYIMKTNLKRLVPAIERELREADNRRRRREAEQALRTSEASLAEAQSIAHIGNWDWDVKKASLRLSDEMYRIFGVAAGEVEENLGSLLARVHPDDRRLVEEAVNGAEQGRSFDMDHRIIRQDGTLRVVHQKTQVTVDDSGRPVRMFGTIQDITERRQTEDTLRALSHRLVTLQEEQSRMTARELHDQFGQTLTVLKIVLDRVRRVPSDKTGPVLDQARVLIDELFQKVHDLSLDLRPPMLDDLGLLPALVWHIGRCQEQTNLRINFKHSGLGGGFSGEVTTVAYRIVQEALTNVLRHAGVNEVQINVWANEQTLHLHIEDRGVGFDTSALRIRGAGLSGMRERASWLGGVVRVESVPGSGTRVIGELPLSGNSIGGDGYDYHNISRRPSNSETRSPFLARDGA